MDLNDYSICHVTNSLTGIIFRDYINKSQLFSNSYAKQTYLNLFTYQSNTRGGDVVVESSVLKNMSNYYKPRFLSTHGFHLNSSST